MFEHKGFTCIIRKMSFPRTSFHCGYIVLNPEKMSPDEIVHLDDCFEKYQEQTFFEAYGNLNIYGFDTNHIYNKPSTQTESYVEKELKKIINVFIKTKP